MIKFLSQNFIFLPIIVWLVATCYEWVGEFLLTKFTGRAYRAISIGLFIIGLVAVGCLGYIIVRITVMLQVSRVEQIIVGLLLTVTTMLYSCLEIGDLTVLMTKADDEKYAKSDTCILAIAVMGCLLLVVYFLFWYI